MITDHPRFDPLFDARARRIARWIALAVGVVACLMVLTLVTGTFPFSFRVANTISVTLVILTIGNLAYTKAALSRARKRDDKEMADLEVRVNRFVEILERDLQDAPKATHLAFLIDPHTKQPDMSWPFGIGESDADARDDAQTRVDMVGIPPRAQGGWHCIEVAASTHERAYLQERLDAMPAELGRRVAEHHGQSSALH